ncbi:MAG TPA: FAD-dependent oxidoreductase [Actinomycetes bacterium]
MPADVVVVGAGALGLSTALHLALLGREVVLLDSGAAGGQASGRAAGLFKSIQPDEVRTVVARRSIERALTFEQWTGIPLAVEQSGSLVVARTGEHGRMLQREVAASRGWGVPVGDLDARSLAGRSSLYRPTGGEQAWWCPEDVYVEEPMSLVHAYVAAAVRHGVELREHEPVVAVERDSDRIVAVVSSTARFETAVVVDAAGAWSRPVAALAGAQVPVVPVRHQLLVTEPSSDVDAADPIVRVVDAAVYLRPARGGLMLGGFEADPLAVLDPQPADPVLDLSVLARMADLVGKEVPSADPARTAEHRGGMFTMSADGRFLIGRAGRAGRAACVDGLWVASGCNGSGFSSSLGLGEVLAQLITGADPYVDVTSLAPGRSNGYDDPGRYDDLVAAGRWQYAHYYDPAH